MKIKIENLKNDMIFFSYMSDEFFIDCLQFQMSFNYYGEKLAKIFYKFIGNKTLEAMEKKHAEDFKKIIGSMPKIDQSFFNFLKNIIKTKDKKIFYDIINYIEAISIVRYKIFSEYIEDENFSKLIEEILEEEKQHGKKFQGSKFLKNLEGFESTYLYNKYKDHLQLSYEEFKTKMWSTVFLKKLRDLEYENL
jgi:hypothetical protein